MLCEEFGYVVDLNFLCCNIQHQAAGFIYGSDDLDLIEFEKDCSGRPGCSLVSV
jgi:hypothetical protein